MAGSRSTDTESFATDEPVTGVDRALQDLHAEVAALHAEMADLRATRNRGSPSPGDGSPAPRSTPPIRSVTTDRRHLLRQGAIAAVAATGAVVALTEPGPAGAATGDHLVLGSYGWLANLASSPTEIRSSDPTAGFVVQNGTATAFPAAAAVVGLANGAAGLDTGVAGATNREIGTGVRGTADGALGVGVRAETSSPTGVALQTQSAHADVQMVAVGPEPSQATPGPGILVYTAGHNLWFGASGQTGSWMHLAGPDTAGSLHLLATAARVYDSRPGYPPLTVTKGRFVSGEQRVITATGVPSGARALLVTATATNTNPGGFFALFRNGTTWSGTSSINWGVANTTIGTTTVVGCDTAARFVARMEGAGGADLVVDVIGYYL